MRSIGRISINRALLLLLTAVMLLRSVVATGYMLDLQASADQQLFSLRFCSVANLVTQSSSSNVSSAIEGFHPISAEGTVAPNCFLWSGSAQTGIADLFGLDLSPYPVDIYRPAQNSFLPSFDSLQSGQAREPPRFS